MVTLTPELIEMTREARIIHYIRRQRRDLTAEQVHALLVRRFGDAAGWSLDRTTLFVEARGRKRAALCPSTKQSRAADAEMKGVLLSHAPSAMQAKEVRDILIERFGIERTPALSTISALLAAARRKAGLAPKRLPYGASRTIPAKRSLKSPDQSKAAKSPSGDHSRSKSPQS